MTEKASTVPTATHGSGDKNGNLATVMMSRKLEKLRERELARFDVLRARARQRRNFLATLLLSQGTPMISHGDELGRRRAKERDDEAGAAFGLVLGVDLAAAGA